MPKSNLLFFVLATKKIYRFFLYDIPNAHLKGFRCVCLLTSKIVEPEKFVYHKYHLESLLKPNYKNVIDIVDFSKDSRWYLC